jgi:hypothetical protein
MTLKTLADIPDAKCNPNIKVGSNLISKVYQRHAWFPFGLVTPIIGVTLGDVEARGVCDILSVIMCISRSSAAVHVFDWSNRARMDVKI